MIMISTDLIKDSNYIIIYTCNNIVNINSVIYHEFKDSSKLHTNVTEILNRTDYYIIDDMPLREIVYIKIDNLYRHENCKLLYNDGSILRLGRRKYKVLLDIIRQHRLDYIKNNI